MLAALHYCDLARGHSKTKLVETIKESFSRREVSNSVTFRTLEENSFLHSIVTEEKKPAKQQLNLPLILQSII